MAPPSFELVQTIHSARSDVHALLSDLHRLRATHPEIISIIERPAPEGVARARRYRVREHVQIGRIRLRARYLAELDPVTDNEVHGNAWQFPRIRLKTVYQLSEAEQGATRVTQKCVVNAPVGLRRFVARRAQAAEEDVLEGVKRSLEGAPPVSLTS